MIKKFATLSLLVFTPLTACSLFQSNSNTEQSQEAAELLDFVDIEAPDELTSIGLGDSYKIKIKPLKKLRIKAHVKGFSILIGNTDVNTEKYVKDISATEEWEFVAKKTSEYEIKITVIDENDRAEVFYKTFLGNELEENESQSESSESTDEEKQTQSLETGSMQDSNKSDEAANKQEVKKFGADNQGLNPNQDLIAKMAVDGNYYKMEQNKVKVLFAKSFIEGRLAFSNHIILQAEGIDNFDYDISLSYKYSGSDPQALIAENYDSWKKHGQTRSRGLFLELSNLENITEISLEISFKDKNGMKLFDFNPRIEPFKSESESEIFSQIW